MAHVYDCSDTAQLLTGTREARTALGRGELAVIPTDTVYGVAADAFNPAAVAKLLAAKGRGRQSPPPVLVANLQTLSALAASVPAPVLALVERFWPGPLTVILQAQPSLSWDLGDTGGTVALRMPAHALTLELLRETGPLAVSSANLTGQPAATNAQSARDMLGDSIAVYLEAGESSADGVSSTIVDAREVNDAGGTIRLLRVGGVSAEQIRSLLPSVTVEEGPWPKP